MALLRNILKKGLSWAGILALSSCLSSAALASDPGGQEGRDAAYRYLNLLRTRAGLLELNRNNQLEMSARDHARYLSLNTQLGHLQSPADKGYTGKTPGDRAVFRGYASRAVTENFSVGQSSARKSIDNLMGAIYHRFAFLDVSKNQLGVGTAENSESLFFVYNMGNSKLDRFCRSATSKGKKPYLADACGNGAMVSAAEFELRRREIGSRNPTLILWPYDQAKGIPTAFYEEEPDPLPDYHVSGYPVSVQLNPFRVRQARLKRFRLFNRKTHRKVAPVRLITRRLDPQQRFGDLDFALFPLNRLDWDTPYRAEIVLVADGREIRRTWSFKTVSPSYPMFVVAGRREILKLRSNQRYLVHVPAVRQYPYIEALRWESMSGLKTEVVWEDRNTLRIQLSGDVCESVHFMFNGDRSFILQVADEDNLNPEQQYNKGSVTGCALDAIKELPGFRIMAEGEVIPMKAGRDYWVEIADTSYPVTEVKWQLMNRMTARVNQLNANLLKIRITGDPGQIATFFLSRSRIFKVVLTK